MIPFFSFKGEARDNPLYIQPEVVYDDHTDEKMSTDDKVNGTAV